MLLYWLTAIVTAKAAVVLRYDGSSDTNYTNHQDSIPNLWRFEIPRDATQDNKPRCDVVGNVGNCSEISDFKEIHLPPNITGLNLTHNKLHNIPDWALANFTQLEWLDVSHNQIQQLHNESFYNLTVLTKLDLQDNNLSMSNKTFPPGVFKPLVSLTHLWINSNTKMKDNKLDYPDTALADLTNLTTLFMDGLPNKTFGAGFESMTSLTNLTLNGADPGHCRLISLSEDMFSHLKSLQYLTLSSCHINGSRVEKTVFVPLKNLTYLNLSHNDILNFEPLGNALSMIINNTNLKTLIISNINNPYSRGICVTKKFASSLPRSLETLDVTSNSLEILEKNVLESLPENLTVLLINDNRFAFASYLQDLYKLENLLILSIAEWNTYDLPRYYPPDTSEGVSCEAPKPSNPERKGHLIQSLPPKLQHVNIRNAGWSNYLTEFHFSENNSILAVSLDWNNFPRLQGPITGLVHLQNLSMIGCNILEIHPSFFLNFTSLKYLNLGINLFGATVFKTGTLSPFRELTNLIYLDLSFCDVDKVQYDAFQGVDNLTTLLLQRNPITNFDIDLTNMTKLTYINVSNTLLATLSSPMRKMLDKLHTVSNLTLDFAVDTLHCFCSDLEFIQWITTTKVLSKTARYNCSYEDGLVRYVSDWNEVYKQLESECITNVKLFSVVISCTCLLIIAILGIIIYHFRWKVWYIYYAAILHYTGEDSKRNRKESFEFDVFVSYAHEDHDFVVNELYEHLKSCGLKVHIHGLHFVAGQYISSNIVNAVQSCRRTLVVLTTNHMNSKWSRFEIEMANIEQVSTGRPVLLFLIMDNLPQISTKILFHLKSNTYIKFPNSRKDHDDPNMQLFWSKLVSDLRL